MEDEMNQNDDKDGKRETLYKMGKKHKAKKKRQRGKKTYVQSFCDLVNLLWFFCRSLGHYCVWYLLLLL